MRYAAVSASAASRTSWKWRSRGRFARRCWSGQSHGRWWQRVSDPYMKAKEGVLDLLNGSLTIELTAVNQYFLASEQCTNWGFPRLRKLFRGLSLEEMKDSEELVKHILYLEGLPNMQRLNQIHVGEDVPELFRAGLTAEL